MIITSLRLLHFRNHIDSSFDTSGREAVLLIGPNGAGKTAVLEAIHLVATGVGIRTRRDAEMMRFDRISEKATAGGYRVELRRVLDAVGSREERGNTLALRFGRRSGRTKASREAFEEDSSLPRWTELIGKTRVTLFRPEDLRLVEGAPDHRRRFLDIMLSQVDAGYFTALRRYVRAVKQRTRSIATGDARTARSFSLVAVEEMPALFAARAKAVERLGDICNRLLESLGFPRRVDMKYVPAIPRRTESGDWKSAAAACIKEGGRIEDRGGVNPFGPHRDDMDLLLDGISLRQYGSQGQKRLVSLFLRLSEAEMMMGFPMPGGGNPERPVLLVDDVFGELDGKNTKAVLGLMKASKCQTWIASTSEEIFKDFWKERVKFDILSGSLEGVSRT